jgi:hypothetical protein
MRLSDMSYRRTPDAMIRGARKGTGVIVCQWVEHYIRELLGTVPPFIFAFLSSDTDASTTAVRTKGSCRTSSFLFLYLDVGRGRAGQRQLSAVPPAPGLDARVSARDATFADYGCQGIPRLAPSW